MMTTRKALGLAMALVIGCAASSDHPDDPTVDDGDGTADDGGGGDQDTSASSVVVGSGAGSGGSSAGVCQIGVTQDCYGGDTAFAGVGACLMGTQTCVEVEDGEFVGGQWGPCEDWVGPETEICGNSIDEDCDGLADQDCFPDDPCAVGRTLELGCGRVFVWGDEHVTHGSYLPDQEPFWTNAVDWLATPGTCGPVRTKIGIDGNLPTSVENNLIAAGFTLHDVNSLTATSLAAVDIVIVEFFGTTTAAEGAALHAWVNAGGALMTLTIGWGNTTECTDVNPAIAPFGLGYACAPSAPWGPVTSFTTHPINTGLVMPTSTPFVNGRWVVETSPVNSAVVASINNGACPP